MEIFIKDTSNQINTMDLANFIKKMAILTVDNFVKAKSRVLANSKSLFQK